MTLHGFLVNKRHTVIHIKKTVSAARTGNQWVVPDSVPSISSLSGPTKEHPLPSILHHKVFKTTNEGVLCYNIAYAYVHKYQMIILHMCN